MSPDKTFELLVGTNAASSLQWLLSSPTAVDFYGQLLV
jgi:hypothetical protein